MSERDLIINGKTALGIELGSTRIKGVLIDFAGNVLAVGIHDWENSFIDNIWTYSLEEIHTGIRDCLWGSSPEYWINWCQRYDAWIYGTG